MSEYVPSDEAVEAASRGLFREDAGDAWTDGSWDATDDAERDAYRETVTPALVAAYPHMVADAVAAIESDRIRCPIHDMPDCSPILNGCTLVNQLHRRRARDIAIIRGEHAASA